MFKEKELGTGWYKCKDCGATHQENPMTSKGDCLIATEYDPATGGSKYKPSGGVVARARKAREGKK